MKISFVTERVLDLPLDSLVNATLEGYDLHRAVLEETDMTNATFVSVNLRGSFLTKSVFINSNFLDSNLVAADFREADLQNALFDNCRVMLCDFSMVNLTNARFINVDIDGANFEKADLRNTDLKVFNWENAKFDSAFYNKYTKWPAGFEPFSSKCIPHWLRCSAGPLNQFVTTSHWRILCLKINSNHEKKHLHFHSYNYLHKLCVYEFGIRNSAWEKGTILNFSSLKLFFSSR